MTRNTKEHYEWRKKVKERDEWTCKHCGKQEGNLLHAHHIIPWRLDPSKRYDINNGITLCKSCHKKEDGCRPAGWNKGLERSKEWRENLSKSLKGRIPWNKNVKGRHFSPMTEFKKGGVPWNKGISSLPNERVCKECKKIKEITEFTPLNKGKFYSHVCKKCRNQKLRIKNNANTSKCNQ